MAVSVNVGVGIHSAAQTVTRNDNRLHLPLRAYCFIGAFLFQLNNIFRTVSSLRAAADSGLVRYEIC